MEELISPPPAPPQMQSEEIQSQPGHHSDAGWQQPLGICGPTLAPIRANFTAAAGC